MVPNCLQVLSVPAEDVFGATNIEINNIEMKIYIYVMSRRKNKAEENLRKKIFQEVRGKIGRKTVKVTCILHKEKKIQKLKIIEALYKKINKPS